MKRMMWYASCAFLAILAVACSHGTAHAAAACSVTSATLPNLVSNYDPVAATATTNITASPTISFVCTGITSNTVVKMYVSGASNLRAGYTTPFLTGPNNFELNYSLCMPGGGTCTGSTGTIWNNTNAYSVSLKSTDSGVTQTVPTPSIFLGVQDAYVGTTTNYTGSLFFAFMCGSPAVTC